MRVGTRGSQLARCQARLVGARLEAGGVAVDLVVIKTSGDRLAEAPLSELGGKRLFVKEIEDALLAGAIDLAVHSSKDMPAVLPDGLAVGAVLPREDPRDALILPGTEGNALSAVEDLLARAGQSPRIGTSSVRRIAQLRRVWPGATFAPIRGNLETRLRKLDAGDYDALVLAAAGLRRLGFDHRISLLLPIDACVPAPGQGAIAVEIRAGDATAAGHVAAISDPLAFAALAAERALVEALGGGCQMPLGAVALPGCPSSGRDELDLHAIVIAPDGARAIRQHARGPLSRPQELGAKVASRLLEAGAGEILEAVRHDQAPVQDLQP